jgi:hypothetical protein
MAELVDALDLGSSVFDVLVRFQLSASCLINNHKYLDTAILVVFNALTLRKLQQLCYSSLTKRLTILVFVSVFYSRR